MALPLLNSAPKYELTIPSTQNKVRFRPFLVKEQKVLMLAYESQDKRQIIQAILDTIKACVDDVDAKNLTTFDIDYLFTQIRAKSVGEKVELQIPCSECSTPNDVQVNLEDIVIENDGKEQIVQLTDDISVKLKHPSYADFLRNQKFFEIESASGMIMEIMLASIDSIMTEEENIQVKDESREELEAFVDSMTGDQFEKISQFVQNMPVLKHTVNFNCISCGHGNERTLQGIDDFF